MTSCCNPHLLLLLVIVVVLLLRGRGLKELLLLIFSRRHEYDDDAVPPLSSIPQIHPPTPRLFAADTWDDAADTTWDTWDDAADASDISGTVWDWFESLIEETLEKLFFAFVFFLLFLLFAELLKQRRHHHHHHQRRHLSSSRETTSDSDKRRRFEPGRNPKAAVLSPLYPLKNRATPSNGRISSAIPTSQYPTTTTLSNLVNATIHTNNSNHVNLDHRRKSPSENRIPHRSVLKSFFAKNSRQNCLPGGRKCSLRQWLGNRKALGFGPLMEFKVPGSSSTVTYVRDDIKWLIRLLVEFLQDQHDRRCCMNGIDVDDIFVDQQSIIINSSKLVGFSEDIQKQDYYSLGIIIKMIIYEETKQVPYDMEHFVTLFNNPMQYKNLFQVHVALINRPRLRDAIMLLGDKKKSLEQNLHLKWKKAVNESTDIDNWIKLIDIRSPLYKVYKKASYYDGGNKVHMIRFLRNAAAHLVDYSNGGKMFQLEDSGLIILASFPNTIADLQERLNHHGILQEFM